MTVTSAMARLSAFAAVIPPNPPPMITTRGRARASGKSLLKRSGGEGHEKHQEDQQHTVRSRGSERQSTELSQNLHRDRPIGMRIEHDARDEFAARGHRREQPTR